MLVICAAVYGIVAAYVFRRFMRVVQLRAVTNRILAHVMEFALFIDEPRLILKAQIDLLKANLQLFRLIGVPCLLMAAAFALAYPAMDRHFGAHQSNVLTLPLGQALPAGLVTETPGVRVLRTGEVSWRIRSIDPPRRILFGWHWSIWFAVIATVSCLPFWGRRFARRA